MAITVLSNQKQNNDSSLAYNALQTSWGWVGILVSPQGIRKLTLPRDSRDLALSALGDLSKAKLEKYRFSEFQDKLQAYLDATIVNFDEAIDLTGNTPFLQSVWQATRQIGYGQLATYRDISVKTGSPKAFRAVGQALKRNPVPIIVPCHRIISSSGLIGGFNGGTALKRKLLQLEQNGLSKTK